MGGKSEVHAVPVWLWWLYVCTRNTVKHARPEMGRPSCHNCIYKSEGTCEGLWCCGLMNSDKKCVLGHMPLANVCVSAP